MSSPWPSAGRLLKVTYSGASQAAPKPEWLVPAAMGQPFKATNQQLVDALSHPAQSVRLVAMRRLADRGADISPLLVKVLQDKSKPPEARCSAIWTLDRIDGGKAGRAAVIAALDDADLSVCRQAARQLGERAAREAVPSLVKVMRHPDRSMRFQAATALGRIGDVQGVAALLEALDETDLFTRYASFTALSRIGQGDSQAWPAISAGLDSDKASIREATLFAFREIYDVAAVEALAAFAVNSQKLLATRAAVMKTLADVDLQAPAWNGRWWNIKPAASTPPAHTVGWPGTAKVQDALRAGLRAPEAKVRQAAAEAMVASADPVLAIELVSFVPKERDAATRRNMLGILAAVKKPSPEFTKSGNQLAADVLSDPKMDAEFVVQALAFAVNLPTITPELADALLKRAKSDLPPAQLTTLLETLGKSKSADVTSVLAAQLGHADEGVRSTGARLLTTRKEPTAAAALIGALRDKSLLVRKEAVAALTARRDKAAVPALLEHLKDADLRFDVINALAQTPDLRALPAYLEGLGGKNAEQREGCAQAVAVLKKEALPAIEARLTEKPPLAAEVVVQLQKVYAGDAAAAKSRLFSVAVSTLALEEYAAVVAKSKGNAESGRKIFFDAKGAACSKCHTVHKQGGDVGPDLSSIGFKYNRLQLIDEVLYPSKIILDGYESYTVELASGRVLVGVIRSETADELTLVDAAGVKSAIKPNEVETKKKTGKSVMPDGLQGGLTPADFADLITYLETLRDKQPEPSKKTGRIGPRDGVFMVNTAGFTAQEVQKSPPKTKPQDFARWEKAITAFEKVDRANPPPKGAVLFVGASTLVLWKMLPRDFPDHTIINRAFGGSEIADTTHFAERIIFPYEPRLILLRAGSNDIHNGKEPQEVLGDFNAFVKKVREKLPATEIVFMSLNAIPSRLVEKDKYDAANKLIRSAIQQMPRASFLDISDMVLSSDGKIRAELFGPDRLHFNEAGYKLLAERVRAILPAPAK